MKFERHIFGRTTARKALALLGCVVLFYFATGAAFLHKHTGGNDTPCHVCQALHLPALQPASAAAIAVPEFLSWYQSRPIHAAPCEAFSFHHAGRAPPAN